MANGVNTVRIIGKFSPLEDIFHVKLYYPPYKAPPPKKNYGWLNGPLAVTFRAEPQCIIVSSCSFWSFVLSPEKDLHCSSMSSLGQLLIVRRLSKCKSLAAKLAKGDR